MDKEYYGRLMDMAAASLIRAANYLRWGPPKIETWVEGKPSLRLTWEGRQATVAFRGQEAAVDIVDGGKRAAAFRLDAADLREYLPKALGVDVEVPKDWHAYYMNLARAVAQYSTCPRAAVGTVLVKDNRVVATGYNGAPSKAPECREVGCLLTDSGRCRRAVHAEVNCLLQTSPGEREGAILYVTMPPCYECAKAIAQTKIVKVVYGRAEYPKEGVALLLSLGKEVEEYAYTGV